jgi:hypothetical protein
MIELFIPMIFACEATVLDPTQNCRLFTGGSFPTIEECEADLAINGIPYVSSILPQGGVITDGECVPVSFHYGDPI